MRKIETRSFSEVNEKYRKVWSTMVVLCIPKRCGFSAIARKDWQNIKSYKYKELVILSSHGPCILLLSSQGGCHKKKRGGNR